MRTRARCFDAVPGLKNAAKSAPELIDVELKAKSRHATRAASKRHHCLGPRLGSPRAGKGNPLLMVSGFVERLILIDKGDNSTESQYYLDLEKRLSLQFSIAVTVVLLSIFACCGRRVP